MTIQRTTNFSTDGDGPGSRLTRLSMRDKIFSSEQVAGNDAGTGFIIIRRGECPPLPRPRGPVRRVA